VIASRCSLQQLPQRDLRCYVASDVVLNITTCPYRVMTDNISSVLHHYLATVDSHVLDPSVWHAMVAGLCIVSKTAIPVNHCL
jgi:hypothetical protein